MAATLIRYLDATHLVGCLVTPDRQTCDMTEYQCTGLEVVERDGQREVHIRLDEIDQDTHTLSGASMVLATLDGYEVYQPLRDLPVVRSVHATWEDACALVGQLVTNRHGAAFVCSGLRLDAGTGQVLIELDDFCEHGEPIGAESGHPRLPSEITFHGPLALL